MLLIIFAVAIFLFAFITYEVILEKKEAFDNQIICSKIKLRDKGRIKSYPIFVRNTRTQKYFYGIQNNS